MKDEAYWRKQFAEANRKLADDSKELDILQREYNLNQTQYYSDPNAALKQEYSRQDLNDNKALIDAKIKGEEIVQPPAQEPAKVIDIMEALKQSLLISKKPATSATEIAPAEAPAGPKKRGSKRASG